MIAIHNPEPQTIDCLVNIFCLDRYVTKVDAKILPGGLIMVARNVNNLCALACFSKQLLNYIAMFLRPVKFFLQLSSVAIQRPTDSGYQCQHPICVTAHV